MRARLIDPGDAAWRETLADTRHDFFHLPEYTAFAARYEGGEPRALVVDDGPHRLILPLVLRPIDGSRFDATSAYGHPGPLSSEGTAADFEVRALQAGAEFLRDEGCVTLFVRLHPLLNAPPPTGVGELVVHGDTVSIDLSLTEEELARQVRRNHRQQIRQAREAGFAALEDTDWRYLADFRHLYRETMRRLSARDFYLFDDAYFEGLREALGERIHLVVVLLDGQVTAAMLVVETDGIVETYLSGSDDAYHRHQPTKLLYDFVWRWAKERGDRWVQLGGGYGAGADTLLHFKAGFSPLRFPFATLRLILDPEECARLTRDRADVARAATPPDVGEYFPAYRRP